MSSHVPPRVGSCDFRLVVLSIAIAMVASYAALDLAGGVTSAGGRMRSVWLASQRRWVLVFGRCAMWECWRSGCQCHACTFHFTVRLTVDRASPESAIRPNEQGGPRDRLRGRKTTGAHIPIVAVTAHAMKEDRDRCLAAGMDGYLTKPIRSQELLRTIENLLEKMKAPKMAGTAVIEDVEAGNEAETPEVDAEWNGREALLKQWRHYSSSH